MKDEAVAIGAAITAANHVPDPNVDRNVSAICDPATV